MPEGLVDEHEKAMNKGEMYISETSPRSVIEAYMQQFQDFNVPPIKV